MLYRRRYYYNLKKRTLFLFDINFCAFITQALNCEPQPPAAHIIKICVVIFIEYSYYSPWRLCDYGFRGALLILGDAYVHNILYYYYKIVINLLLK